MFELLGFTLVYLKHTSMNNVMPRLVLFDLGGVLVELGNELFPPSWFSGERCFDLKQWLSCSAALEFETGRISASHFIQTIKEDLQISATESQILTAFTEWPRRLFPTAQALLERVSTDYQIAVLSNTNEIHEPVLLHRFGLEKMVEDTFFSHRIGLAKPNKEAFLYVLNALNYQASEVLFFDDNLTNVTAARSIGMTAIQVNSPEEVAAYF